jgi:DNA transformation protein
MASRDESFKDFVLDQLQDLDGVDARRMFGGYGLYRDETFFGILHKGKLYFKVDESTIGEYRKRKMKPFRPNLKQTLRSYYQVPVDYRGLATGSARGQRRRFVVRGRRTNRFLWRHGVETQLLG